MSDRSVTRLASTMDAQHDADAEPGGFRWGIGSVAALLVVIAIAGFWVYAFSPWAPDRKADALGMVLSEMGISEGVAGARTYALRRVLGKMIPLAVLVILAVLVMALGSAILPSREVLLLLLLVAAALTAFLWRSFVQVHARLQAALRDVMRTPSDGGA